MSYLGSLFAQPQVAGWLSFAGEQRKGRIAEDDGVVGKNNIAWQNGERSDYYIEAQRIGYQVVLGGLASDNADLVGRGLSAIEWGLQPSVLGPTSDWSYNRDYDDILAHAAHPRTMFGAAAAETVRAILEDDTLPAEIHDRAEALVPAVGLTAASFIASGDAATFTAQCANSSQLVFSATWLQGAYVLTGDKSFKAPAKAAIKQMMELQRPDGAFGERGGADTSYALLTLQQVVEYRDMIAGHSSESWFRKVSKFATQGANWILSRVQPDGSIDTTGNTRTGEDGPPLEGDFAKGWNLDRNAIMLAQYAVAFDRWDELAPVIAAVQFRGQEYDHIADIVAPTG